MTLTKRRRPCVCSLNETRALFISTDISYFAYYRVRGLFLLVLTMSCLHTREDYSVFYMHPTAVFCTLEKAMALLVSTVAK